MLSSTERVCSPGSAVSVLMSQVLTLMLKGFNQKPRNVNSTRKCRHASCHLQRLEALIKYLITQSWDWLYRICHSYTCSFIWSSSTTKKEKEKENKTPIEVVNIQDCSWAEVWFSSINTFKNSTSECLSSLFRKNSLNDFTLNILLKCTYSEKRGND